MEDLKFAELSNGEKSRTYKFPSGEVTIKDVARICVRPSGSHRLETADGRKWIVPVGWMAIEIVAEAWSV